jgi:hypothetical protein
LRQGQKKCQPSAVAPGWHDSSQGDLFTTFYAATGSISERPADDLIGGAEDSLGALFGYCFRIKTVSTAEPILNVTSAKLRSIKSQRFAT